MSFSAADLAAWSGGSWTPSAPAEVSGISNDTRTIRAGDLYVAIRGDAHDGHKFTAAAFAAGAAACMVDEEWRSENPDAAGAFLVVRDTVAALSAMAAGHRKAVDPTIVGLTGSVGKTTVKEITARLLSTLGATAKTVGNWNNALGLPKSLLEMPRGTAYGVFETGTNHPGEIAPLAALLEPDAAILTNIGDAHIGNFGNRQATADEKADLLRAVPESGFVVLDANDAFFPYLREQCRCRVVAVSADPAVDADFTLASFDSGTLALEIAEKGGSRFTVKPDMPGEHQRVNILLAVACARTLGAKPEAIADALDGWSPGMHGRWEKLSIDGVTYINDAYNANPQSMLRAIETFAAAPCSGKRIAVLGDMGELGEECEHAMHLMVGRAVFDAKIDELVCVGPKSAWYAEEARICGMSPKHIKVTADSRAAAPVLAALAKPGDAVLLKGSHAVEVDRALPTN